MLIFSTLAIWAQKSAKIIEKKVHKCIRGIEKCRTFASQKRKSK